MYSIAGFRKVKNKAQLAALANHNLRIKLGQADKDRIDPQRVSHNEILVNTLQADLKDAADLGAKLFTFYEKNAVEVKKDSVLAIDLMLTASPEFFGNWHQNGKLTAEGRKKIDEWKQVQLDFVRAKFGADLVKLAVLHLDESTPHIHLLVTPEQKKTATYKNQYGTKTVSKYILNANRWNPGFWKKFVTDHAKANQKFGLKRGDDTSLEKNITVKEFRKRMKKATNEDFEKTIDRLLDQFIGDLSMLNTPNQTKEKFNSVFRPALTTLIKSNKALKVASEKAISERVFLKKVRADFEKKLEALEKDKKRHEAKYTEIDRLRKELAESKKTVAQLESQNEKLEKKLFQPLPSSNQNKFANRA